MDDRWERAKVIAVFGGNQVNQSVLALAGRVTQALISCDDVILLTGAVPPPVQSQVKGTALRQVLRSNSKWIGVHNCPHSECGVPSSVDPSHGIVLHPGMGEQRNFLEALLCDAAIVLPGGSGAISEAVSTLCLGKPVLLGGTGVDWEEHGCRPLLDLFVTQSANTDTAKRLIERSRGPLGSTGPLLGEVQATLVPDKLLSLPHRCAVLPNDPDSIASWVADVPRTGGYPNVAGQAAAKAEYDNWLLSAARARSNARWDASAPGAGDPS